MLADVTGSVHWYFNGLLGIESIKAGKSVFFATLAELVDYMRKAEREGRLRERVKFLSRYSLLIVDDIGYLVGPAIARQPA